MNSISSPDQNKTQIAVATFATFATLFDGFAFDGLYSVANHDGFKVIVCAKSIGLDGGHGDGRTIVVESAWEIM